MSTTHPHTRVTILYNVALPQELINAASLTRDEVKKILSLHPSLDLSETSVIEELRDMCVEMDVRMIGCQMTMDVFGFKREDFIEECEIGGAATFLEYAADADVQLFI